MYLTHLYQNYLTKQELIDQTCLTKYFVIQKMLSADVDAGVDPLYISVSDTNNAGFLGLGVSLNKYTGSGGKYNASDANAEYVGEIRRVFKKKWH